MKRTLGTRLSPKGIIPIAIALICLMAMIILRPEMAFGAAAERLPIPDIRVDLGGANTPQEAGNSIALILLLTVLSLAPAILIMMTSFIRIVIVLSFIRNALGLQQVPPNQVVIGLALFLTFFVMAPTLNTINDKALAPYLDGKINQEEAISRATGPLRDFMFKQTREKDIALFVRLAKAERPRIPDDVATYVLIPAFVTSELRRAFEIGFIVYIPFLVIDMVVASVLMSMGMLMLPPVMISLPFKLLLFVMVDGWDLIIGSLITSFK